MARLKTVDVEAREQKVFDEFLAGRSVDDVQTMLKAETGAKMNLNRIYVLRRAAAAGESLPPKKVRS